MKQFKCKNSVPKAFNRLRQARRCRSVWQKILFPLELIFDSCNNIMMKSTRNMSKSHCKGKIKFIIYGYYYLPSCVTSTHSPLSIRRIGAHWTSADIRIQIIRPEKSILLWPPSDQIRPRDVIRINLIFPRFFALRNFSKFSMNWSLKMPLMSSWKNCST